MSVFSVPWNHYFPLFCDFELKWKQIELKFNPQKLQRRKIQKNKTTKKSKKQFVKKLNTKIPT